MWNISDKMRSILNKMRQWHTKNSGEVDTTPDVLTSRDDDIMEQTLMLSKEIYEADLDRAKLSDDKANILLSMIGVLSGLLFFSLTGYSKSGRLVEFYGLKINLDNMIVASAILSAIAIFVDIMLLVDSLRTRTFFVIGKKEVYELNSKDGADAKRYLAEKYMKYYMNNIDTVNKKITRRNLATYSIVVTILLLLLLFTIRVWFL